MKYSLLSLAALIATPSFAQETREMDAHIHGTAQLNIAVEGKKIAMELTAPGADIVGFEYDAKTEEDHTAIKNALEKLESPLALFELPAAANCTVTHAHANLHNEEHHDDHDDHKDHDEHENHDEHKDHEKHDEHKDHDDHDKHEDHDGHDDHDKHEDHDGHDDHDKHEEEANHAEFHGEYALTCDDISAITSISFAYFSEFENAQQVDIQIVTTNGASTRKVMRDAPVLDVNNLF